MKPRVSLIVMVAFASVMLGDGPRAWSQESIVSTVHNLSVSGPGQVRAAGEQQVGDVQTPDEEDEEDSGPKEEDGRSETPDQVVFEGENRGPKPGAFYDVRNDRDRSWAHLRRQAISLLRRQSGRLPPAPGSGHQHPRNRY